MKYNKRKSSSTVTLFVSPGSRRTRRQGGNVQARPNQKPKREIDATSDEQAVSLGIYELEADHYKVCFAPAGNPRPAKFGSDSGSGQILQVWQRQKNN